VEDSAAPPSLDLLGLDVGAAPAATIPVILISEIFRFFKILY
jgi:hypothetical protein